MVADELVGLGSTVTDFPTALLESATFLTCCGISHVVSVLV